MTAVGDGEASDVQLVDWARTGRRMAAGVVVFQGLAVLAWLVVGLAGDGLSAADLFGFVGVAVLASFALEVVVVGGSAVRGMLRAGERGDRLAGPDVGLLPARRRSAPPAPGADDDGGPGTDDGATGS